MEIFWNEAKTKVHDISGIENPENYVFEEQKGVYYPIREMTAEDKMFDELDPDSDAVPEGYIVKLEKVCDPNYIS